MEQWKWTCPACSVSVESLGPNTLQLEIINHIRAHERAARHRAFGDCGRQCSERMTTSMFCAARNFGEEGPTPFDEQFLGGIRVAWDAPVTADEIKRLPPAPKDKV